MGNKHSLIKDSQSKNINNIEDSSVILKKLDVSEVESIKSPIIKSGRSLSSGSSRNSTKSEQSKVNTGVSKISIDAYKKQEISEVEIIKTPNYIEKNDSIGSRKSIQSTSHSESPSAKSGAESISLNQKAAELWQPQFFHMMRPDARMDNSRRFHNIEESLYVLPADIEEQDRLEIQHAVLILGFGGLFRMPIHEIISKPGAKILDVGCGPGSWTRDVATKYPLCEVHAIDMAKSLFDGIEILPNTFFAEGNILERLPC
ncbi:hypothetical protein HK096_010521 [Nowakowskiella sp. JEL0078]|nr:hypothetical protein HK096_010521 [Nowakowskiella sp. JEL0078]